MLHQRTCSICEALCGIEIEVQNEKIISIRGNPKDPLSQGYICPKGVALQDLHNDPDRLRQPLLKKDGAWVPVSWDEALELTATKLSAIREEFGPRSVAIYAGNPNAHNYATLLVTSFFHRAIKSQNRFSATSADQLPHMFAALHMFGHQLLLPVVDIDRTDLFIVMGGNPLASNGSLMTAPNMRQRIKSLQKRGGKLVVIDPRKTETAKAADKHLFIKPGTDAFFLMSLIHVLFRDNLIRPGRWESFSEMNADMTSLAAPFTPDKIAGLIGMESQDIVAIAHDLAQTKRAALYGRLGVCTQEFGGLNAWLIYLINILTNHLDEPGGLMFASPAVDLVEMSAKIKQSGSYNRFQSRVRKLPEFSGEMPVVTLTEEIKTPGPGQIKALVTIAGNPVLSTPNGKALADSLKNLDFMVAVDMYLNETTKHADLILPSTSPLEKDHFGLVFHGLAVRNTIKYSERLFKPIESVRDDWEILLHIASRIAKKDSLTRSVSQRVLLKTLLKAGPKRLLDLMIRFGPHGRNSKEELRDLTLQKLIDTPEGFDLGPLKPTCPQRLFTKNKKIALTPRCLINDIPRLQSKLVQLETAGKHKELLLIGRRQLRSNNSWLHNSQRLIRGKDPCTLLINPKDAALREIKDGDQVTITSRTSAITVAAEITDHMMAGVVSLPHGFGHGQKGTQLSVANAHPGQSINDLTDTLAFDELTGNAGFSAIPVAITTPSIP